MSKAFLRWREIYIETFRTTNLLTQLFSFCVALILIFGFIESTIQVFALRSEISPALWQNVVTELSVRLFVALLFAARFSLLFFRKEIYFVFSQAIWLVTYATLLSQISSPEFGGCTKNAFPMFGENLSYLFVAYLFVSPLRQAITLLVSLNRIYWK